MSNKITKVVILPGNGAGNVFRANWYGWLHKKVDRLEGITCRLENMPDPVGAKESVWVPFMKDTLGVDENTVIVGHSSGAVAAVRFAEKYKVGGILLVSGYSSDLGDANERESGYFSRPWCWEETKANSGWICQFGSMDDPFLPWDEQEEMATGLSAKLMKFTDKGHFMSSTCPDILKVLTEYIVNSS